MQEKNLYQCQLCNFKTTRTNSLIIHVHRKHNILPEQYYNKYGTTGKKDNKCIICGKPTKYLNFNKGYSITCGRKCAVVYSENICLEKYKVKHPMQNEQIQEKSKATCLKKYGVEYSMQNKQVNNKKKETFLKRYGVENPAQNKQIQSKIKETNLKKYGVKYPMQNEQINNKKKETFLKKYEVENPSMKQAVKQKIKETNLKKYGVKYPMQNKQIQIKVKNTILKMYGVENPFQAQEVKQKIKQTFIKKYGYSHYMQNEQMFNKVMSSYNLKSYNYNNHIIHYQSKPQLQFIKLCQQLRYQVYDGPTIKYQFQEKNYITYPDFLLQYPNKKKRIVQIKGNHHYHKRDVISGKFEAKCTAIKQYSKQNGYLDFIVVMH